MNPSKTFLSFSVRLLLATGVILLVGCESPRVRVNTDPPRAAVTVRDAGGQTVASGAAPLIAPLRLSKPDTRYTLEAVPSQDAADQFYPATATLTRSTYDALPEDSSSRGLRQLDIKLAARPDELRIATTPSGSIVLVKDSAGLEVRSGPAPLVVPLHFSSGQRYVVEVKPSDSMTERYLPMSRTIDGSTYSSLPAEREAKTRLLEVRLDPRPDILRIATTPPGSIVTIKDTAGLAVRSGPAPVVVPLHFSNDERYVVEVKPSDSMTERYLPMSRTIDGSTYSSFPAEREVKTRLLEVRLDEKQFVTITEVQLVLDSKRSWRGVVTRSRAFKDVGETGGAVPTRIIDFGENIGIQSMALSPDGRRIVYSLAAYHQSMEDLQKIFAEAESRQIDIAGANLHAVSVDAGGIEHITSENFRDMFPSFTTDGEKLLFSSNRRRANSEDILMISALRRSGISDIYVDHRDARILRPTQAQDGTIAFAVEEPNPVDSGKRFTIWTLGGVNQFPTQIQTGSQPAISPDGKRIAYIGPDGNLWVVNTDGSQATQLSFDAKKILQRYRDSLSSDELKAYDWFVRELGVPAKTPFSYPSWSKDGQSILYTGMEGSDPTGRPNEDVWIMRFDGSGKRQLTTNGSIDRYPLLSPDLKWIYFMSNRGGRWAIWRIPAPESMAPNTAGQ